MSKVKEQCKKQRKRLSNSLLEFFFKKNSRPLSSSCPIFYSFVVCLQWFKTCWVHQLKLYQLSLYSRCKETMIKDFKLEILICFNSPITKHWTPLHQTSYIFPFLYGIEQFLQHWKRWAEGYKFSFIFRNRGTICQNLTSFEFWNVCSLAYLPKCTWRSNLRHL